MHPNRFLPIFMLAVAGTDFLLAMHPETDGAAPSDAASTSNTKTEPHHPGLSSTDIHTEHHHDFDYDNEGTVGSVRVGSSGKPTEFLFVDTHEPDKNDTGYYLKLKDVQIRLGNEKLYPPTYGHISPYAARFELTLWEQQNPDLKVPKDLEGIELEIAYGFIYRIMKDWVKLNNGEMVKKVAVKIPKNGVETTEEEKEILKGIFIGGDKFRVEVQKNGNAEIKFQKNLSPGTMKFTADYYKNLRKKGQMVQALYSYGPNLGFQFESVSLAESTFTINWAAAGIKEVEQLRAVNFTIFFKLDDFFKLSADKNGKRHSRYVLLRDLPNDTLEQLFVGGEATIHLKLSNIDYDMDIKIGAVPVTKPKTAFDTFKSLIKLG